MHQNHIEGFLKQIAGPNSQFMIQKVGRSLRNLIAISQLMLMLVVWVHTSESYNGKTTGGSKPPESDKGCWGPRFDPLKLHALGQVSSLISKVISTLHGLYNESTACHV